jgi:NAD(P)-dependent dehydrogenase (short-subunit alcohol dehydrogenase family)
MLGPLIITGASRGIGAATARLAAQRGYSVCINYKSARSQAEALVAELEASGCKAIAVAADISVEADVVRLFKTCDERLGPLVGLVNNAGILETQMRPFPFDLVIVSLLRMLAIVSGAYMLRGANWARWLAISWIAFHVGVSYFHSWARWQCT